MNGSPRTPVLPPRPSAPARSVRQWIRRAFPLADGVTYVIAGGALAATWLVVELLDRVAAYLAGVL